jgi:bifunctional NMN adenylyltransferase/nudix hydrolase
VSKPSYGVIVGRFQVNDLHDGHMELFRQVRFRHSGVIVFVGVSPAGLTKDNPLDFPTRKAMIQAKFPEFTVLPLMDCKLDTQWSDALDAQINAVVAGQAEVVLYGGRDSFVPHYEGRYKPVELALPVETQKISGTDIRREFANKVIESPEFRAGMIYAAAHLWPVLLPTVDIAIFNSDYTEVLLGRRASETKFRFIGGHAEKKHGSYEQAARSETLEEAGLDPGKMDYIGSAIIPDWRYATSDRGVMTAFFATTSMSMGAKAGDDIDEVKWFKVTQLTASDLVDTHQVLYRMLADYRNKIVFANINTPKIYGPTDRPESAGMTLRTAIKNEEKTTGALRVTDPDPTSILPRDNSVDPTRIMG